MLVTCFQQRPRLPKPLINKFELAIAKNDTVWVFNRHITHLLCYILGATLFLATLRVFSYRLVSARLINQFVEVEAMGCQKVQRRGLRKEIFLCARHDVKIEGLALETLHLLIVLKTADSKL